MPKKKPQKDIIRYIKSQKRYSKMVKGKNWYSPRGLTESAEDYRIAYQHFLEWLEEQNNPYDFSIFNMIEIDPNDFKDWWKSDDPAKRAFYAVKMKKSYQGAFGYDEDGNKQTHKINETGTVKQAVDLYLRFKEGRIGNDSLTPLKSHLGFFTDHVGNRNIKAFDLESWHTFTEAQQEQLKKGKWSPTYAKGVLNAVRSLFIWLEDTEQIDRVPSFVKSKLYNIVVPPKKVKPFTQAEIKTLLKESSSKQRCYYLLMLNTAMTQKDLSELTPDMIDWKKGILTRTRTKHEDRENGDIPEVKYHLWESTFKLLKEHGNRKGDLVFRNERNNPLVGSNRTDSVASAFKVIRKKTEITKTLKYFRKSGTSALGTSPQYKLWRETYLANSGSTVTDRHYDGTTMLPKEVTDYIAEYLEIDEAMKELNSI